LSSGRGKISQKEKGKTLQTGASRPGEKEKRARRSPNYGKKTKRNTWTKEKGGGSLYREWGNSPFSRKGGRLKAQSKEKKGEGVSFLLIKRRTLG